MGLLSDWGKPMFGLDLSAVRDRQGQPVTFGFREELPELDRFEGAGSTVGPVDVTVTVTYLEGIFWLEGTVEGRFGTECARCLEPVRSPFGIKLVEKYTLGRRDDAVGIPVDGDFIDLTERIVESVLLALPMKPLCGPDCLGLCAECGQALNKAACDCRPEGVDPRLAGLGKLFKTGMKGVE